MYLLKKRLCMLGVCLFVGAFTIVGIYQISYSLNHRPNGFIRLFPAHPLSAKYVLDLPFNSYYLAGITEGRIYLGNYSTPAYLLSINHHLNDTQTLRITFPPHIRVTKQAAVLTIDSPFLFLSSYRDSLLMSGSFSDLTLSTLSRGTTFIESRPISPSSFVFQTQNLTHDQNILTKWAYRSPANADTNTVTDPQHLGIIITDGKLCYDKTGSHIFYVYYYHNEFICFDTSLNKIYIAKTIDTISTPQITLARMNGGSRIAMGSPPLRVNKNCCVNGQRIFIQSGLPANNEIEKSLDQHSVVDVYQESDGKYLFSFHISNYDHEKMKGFQVFGRELIVLYDHALLIYWLLR